MSLTNSNNPIGVFDSGLGGLSVLRAIRAQMPAESVIYFGDQGHLPYPAKRGIGGQGGVTLFPNIFRSRNP